MARANRSHDNGRFASCGGERLVYVWDVATGRIVRRLAGHFQRINTLDFNKDATVLASGTMTRDPRAAGTKSRLGLLLMSNCPCMHTGSYDATVRLWDLRAQTNEPIQVLDQAKDSITSVRVAAHTILVGSVDGSVREYDLRMGLLRTDHLGGARMPTGQSEAAAGLTVGGLGGDTGQCPSRPCRTAPT